MDQIVICGDSRWVIPDEEFDLVVTSPPYNVGIEYVGHDDALPVAGWRALVTSVLSEAWDRLVEGGRLCVNVQHGVGRSPMIPLGFHVEGIGHALPGALYRGAVVWHKGPVNTTTWGSWQSPSNPALRGTYEMVYIWSKGTLSRSGGTGDLVGSGFTEATLDTWHIAAEQSRRQHPAPFPVALAERLIRLYSWPGDRVLDPFCGIGSSGVAAARSGRSWVGIDISHEYCDLAETRIAVALAEPEVDAGAGLDDDLIAFAHELASGLADGAVAAGRLEVRRFSVGPDGPWERYRRTLSNQVTVGAYGLVRKLDGSRVGWTTSHRRSHVLTLQRWSRKPVRTISAKSPEALRASVYEDAVRVLAGADPDRRTRAISVRGVAPADAGTESLA